MIPIRPLVWHFDHSGVCLLRSTGIDGAVYDMHGSHDDFWAIRRIGPSVRDVIGSGSATIELAQATAQADHAARVLAAIDTDALREMITAAVAEERERCVDAIKCEIAMAREFGFLPVIPILRGLATAIRAGGEA